MSDVWRLRNPPEGHFVAVRNVSGLRKNRRSHEKRAFI